MRHILLDAMGGDNAPQAVVDGCVLALGKYPDVKITLVGQQGVIEALLKAHSYDASRLAVLHASEVITTEEAPVNAIRAKRDSSLTVALRMLRDGQAEGFISAGSTGAVLAGSQLILKTIKGIHRPALAPMLPTAKEPALLIDCGANVDCKPINLEQFAVMGTAYMRVVEGRETPRVGLINIGAEEEKGNALVKEAHQRLKALPINFVGNVEAREIPSGDVDVLVCDAFVGNVVLKFMEGLAGTLFDMLKKELYAKPRYKLGALLAKGAFRNFKKSMDYSEYGGAPLLGVNGCVFKSHGSSDAKAICSTVGQMRQFIEGDTVAAIAQQIEACGLSYDRFAK